jgi:hypothetical protein
VVVTLLNWTSIIESYIARLVANDTEKIHVERVLLARKRDTILSSILNTIMRA